MTSEVYNKQALNNFTSMMLDVQLPRNPLASEVIVVFNESVRDQYQDVVTHESCRVKKLALVRKDPDMSYVQQDFEVLVEDDPSRIPWVVKMTMTGLPRRPRSEDQVVVDGLRYNISYVQPLNRSLDNIVLLTVYPDRNDVDTLAVYAVSELDDGYYDILYGGAPTQYSYDRESLVDDTKRLPFTSRPKIPEVEEHVTTLYIFDKDGNSASFKLSSDV